MPPSKTSIPRPSCSSNAQRTMSVLPAKATPGRPTFRELQSTRRWPFRPAPPFPLRGDDYDFTDAAGPGITEHKFRRGLALPVHQQSDESDHAKRRRIDAAWTDRVELHRPVHAHQHGHQLEHLRDDRLALPCASGSRGRSDALSDAAHHLLPAHQLLGESAARCELRAQSFLQLYRPGDGCGIRSEFARQSAPAFEDRWRQHADAVADRSSPDSLLLLRPGADGRWHRRFCF